MTNFNFKTIDHAYDLISSQIVKTPMISNDYINQITGGKIFFKLGNKDQSSKIKQFPDFLQTSHHFLSYSSKYSNFKN